MKMHQVHAHYQQLPTHTDIKADLWISFRDDPAHSVYPSHGHAWGEFIYAFDGVMEVSIGTTQYITPPPYGIWLPPHLQHSGLNRTPVSHGTLYVHEKLCNQLPKQAGILLSSPLVSALFLHLKQQPLPHIATEIEHTEHQRMLQVIVDQLQYAQLLGSYLPSSDHPLLNQLLSQLHAAPADTRHIASLAKQFNLSERTLARLCQRELGMSLNEWRQRLKVMKAMSLLNQGQSVEHIAFDLGYASASAFIHMFKRWMQLSPDQFRKISLGKQS